ncbi:MAG TPA: alcohol dehydrogenase catalytic domain-containing protein [Gaiellaceae bacterium]|jgi:threonine dehydrogenase-like Zn-dependent dehydrogenase|nr:alcohol dehydrogenase catalytic domain-containing protein [Gaiellaceae bacterium]
MRAVRVGTAAGAELIETDRPSPEEGEALVRVQAAAICATDRKLAARGARAPVILGHELAGRLEDGRVVGVHPDVGCGTCRFCRAGFENRCADRVSIGIDRDGGLAEWVAVPERQALPLDGVPLEVSPVLEPLACCLHAVRLLDVRPDDPALVVGAGAMGILSMWALQQAGARVAVSQRSQERRELAAELGADSVLGPDESAEVALGEPPRVAIVTAPGAEPLVWALEAVATGGAVHAFAGTPSGARVDANVVHYRHLRLMGSTGSALSDYKRAVELVAGGRIQLDRLPRTTVSLDEVPKILLGERTAPGLKVTVDVGGASG